MRNGNFYTRDLEKDRRRRGRIKDEEKWLGKEKCEDTKKEGRESGREEEGWGEEVDKRRKARRWRSEEEEGKAIESKNWRDRQIKRSVSRRVSRQEKKDKEMKKEGGRGGKRKAKVEETGRYEEGWQETKGKEMKKEGGRRGKRNTKTTRRSSRRKIPEGYVPECMVNKLCCYPYYMAGPLHNQQNKQRNPHKTGSQDQDICQVYTSRQCRVFWCMSFPLPWKAHSASYTDDIYFHYFFCPWKYYSREKDNTLIYK